MNHFRTHPKRRANAAAIGLAAIVVWGVGSWIAPAAVGAMTPAASQTAPDAGQSSNPCGSPLAAVQQLLDWQQPGHHDAERASRCIAPRALRKYPYAAAHIKDVLDTGGLYIQYKELSGNPYYLNQLGEARHFVAPGRDTTFYVSRVATGRGRATKGGDRKPTSSSGATAEQAVRWEWSAEVVRAAEDAHAKLFLVDVGSWINRLPPGLRWLQGSMFGLQAWQLMGLLGLALVAVLVRTWVTFLAAKQTRRVMEQLGAHWGKEMLAQVDRPLGLLGAVAVVSLMLPALHLPVQINQILRLLLQVLAACSAVWAVYRLVDLFCAWLQEKAAGTTTKLDDQLVPLIRRALKVFTIAVGAIFVLQNLNIDVAGLLAGLGLGGLAFALAAKETISNIFGSATIFADRPFQIGDWVEVDGAEGIVEAVGFRSTRIRTFYNSLITLPNAKVADAKIDNYGARRYRRFKTNIGFTYDSRPERLEAFVEQLKASIAAHPHTRKDVYEVHLNSFGPSSLNVLLYMFFDVPNWSDELRERHNFMLEIIRLAGRLELRFAFPTQTLHVESLPPPTSAQGSTADASA